VAELVDAADSKSVIFTDVPVQVRSGAPSSCFSQSITFVILTSLIFGIQSLSLR